jgi:hypothetical protein
MDEEAADELVGGERHHLRPRQQRSPSRRGILMKLTAAQEPPGDVGRLQLGAFRRRMGSEIAGDGDEDMPSLVGIAPLLELPHSGFQHLVGMESCVLAQQRPRQRGDQRLHRVTKREMTRDETRGEIDLSLPIEGVEQGGPDRLRIGGQVIERLAAIAGMRAGGTLR